MRSFLIVCVCLAALAGGAYLAYYASNHVADIAQTVNTGNSVYSVVQSLPNPAQAGSPDGAPQAHLVDAAQGHSGARELDLDHARRQNLPECRHHESQPDGSDLYPLARRRALALQRTAFQCAGRT